MNRLMIAQFLSSSESFLTLITFKFSKIKKIMIYVLNVSALKSERPNFKNFNRTKTRFKYETQIKQGWSHLKLKSVFRYMGRLSIGNGYWRFSDMVQNLKIRPQINLNIYYLVHSLLLVDHFSALNLKKRGKLLKFCFSRKN